MGNFHFIPWHCFISLIFYFISYTKFLCKNVNFFINIYTTFLKNICSFQSQLFYFLSIKLHWMASSISSNTGKVRKVGYLTLCRLTYSSLSKIELPISVFVVP